jgi:hypothetical protein
MCRWLVELDTDTAKPRTINKSGHIKPLFFT